MSAQPQQISSSEAERGSLTRWNEFSDQVEDNIQQHIHRLLGDILEHERVVQGENGENAYVACGHPMHDRHNHWTMWQSWPCPELLHAAEALDIDISSSIEMQRQLDAAAYGEPIEPGERLRRWAESLPEGARDIVLRHHKVG